MGERITRRFQFCAGHRILNHESKCAHPHGHNYVAHVTVESENGLLDALGRVVDFSVVKDLVGDWIDRHWDHGFIYYEQDDEMCKTFATKPQWKSYAMHCNPTAENMAMSLLCAADRLLRPRRLRCVSVRLEETENCSAEVSL